MIIDEGKCDQTIDLVFTDAANFVCSFNQTLSTLDLTTILQLGASFRSTATGASVRSKDRHSHSWPRRKPVVKAGKQGKSGVPSCENECGDAVLRSEPRRQSLAHSSFSSRWRQFYSPGRRPLVN